MGFRGPEALTDNLEHRWDCQTPQDLGPVSEKSLLRRVPSQVTVIGDTFKRSPAKRQEAQKVAKNSSPDQRSKDALWPRIATILRRDWITCWTNPSGFSLLER